MAVKRKKINVSKEIKSIARERIGRVPAGKTIIPKRLQKKPKHKKPIGEDTEI